MPPHANPNKLKFYFEPLPVPEDILNDYATWQDTCVRIPIPLIPYITPVLRIWQSRGCLYGTDEEKELFIRIWTDLIGRINVGGNCEANMLLRQNPSNSCQLQQSFNSGATWALAFDYSLCLHPAQAFILQLELSNLFNTWNNATSNSEINIFAPVTTFVSSDGDSVDRIAARKQALCYAVDLYIHAYIEAIRKINHDASATANLVNLAYSLATALAFAFSVGTEGAGTPVFMAVGASAASAGIAGFNALTDAVLDDSGAIAELVCCMYSTLKTLSPIKENFAISVDSCDGLSTNAELIRVALARDISNIDGLNNQFHAFINLLGDELRPAELGLLPDCACETKCKMFDFTIDKQGWEVFETYGIYVAGIGFNSDNQVTLDIKTTWTGAINLKSIRFLTSGQVPGTHQVNLPVTFDCFIQGGNDGDNDFTIDLSNNACYQGIEGIMARIANSGLDVVSGIITGIEICYSGQEPLWN